ncbi:flagellar biosynthesis repressor FlbT [Ferrovibrio sp.]|uniref:flagellar biosynthesis repressor FlbT n=1 Tax=Ferrovibrio sp. TaxID=1917215 RepID=UPI0025B8A1C8|nr:flagellar biosynthesis repressor FlbT [Ferrovibrio sp.]MBX3454124.1 flagellar biosynthesis repressor FlbT [Ferrovibrio sp.]
MPLIITLKAGEKFILNRAVLSLSKPASIIIENKASFLREKHIMREEDADTPAKVIYYMCQLTYLWEEKFDEYYPKIKDACLEFVKAAPSTNGLIGSIGSALAQQDFFRLLKHARRLIEVERRLLDVGNKSVPKGAERS